MKESEAKALRLLGFAARARAVTLGVALTCEALRSGAKGRSPLLVLLAADASPNSVKRMTDKTTSYRTPLYTLSADSATLATTVGKRESAVAAVGVTDPSLAAAIGELLG